MAEALQIRNAALRRGIGGDDTLYSIAGRFGVSVAALKRANDLKSDRIRTGAKLVIPG
jgi:hypothetical protein